MKRISSLSGSEGAIHFRGHIVELDSLRAIGIALVLIGHFWHKSMGSALFWTGQCAWIAMDSFFVLSGLLITGILLDTRDRPGYLRNYYLRRCLRIFPLYYLVLLIWVILLRFSWGGDGAEYKFLVQQWGSPAWFAFYLGNFRVAYLGRWPPVTGLDPLWSLQVEEQFYLLFPFVVLWMRREHLSKLLWILVFLSPLFRVLCFLCNPKNPYLQYVLLPCHMEGLALGALLAIRLRSGPWRIHKPALAVLTLLLLAAVFASSIWSRPVLSDWAASSDFNRLMGYSISSWGCAGLVLLLILFRGSKYTSWSRVAPLQFVGKISYGLYLLHPLASRLLRWSGRVGFHLRPNTIPSFIAIVVLSVLLATLSWYCLEKPLLGLKDRLAPRPEARNEKVLAGV